MHACMHARVCIYYVTVCVCVTMCLHARVYVHACMQVHEYAFALHSYNFIHVHACTKLYATLVCTF